MLEIKPRNISQKLQPDTSANSSQSTNEAKPTFRIRTVKTASSGSEKPVDDTPTIEVVVVKATSLKDTEVTFVPNIRKPDVFTKKPLSEFVDAILTGRYEKEINFFMCINPGQIYKSID